MSFRVSSGGGERVGLQTAWCVSAVCSKASFWVVLDTGFRPGPRQALAGVRTYHSEFRAAKGTEKTASAVRYQKPCGSREGLETAARSKANCIVCSRRDNHSAPMREREQEGASLASAESGRANSPASDARNRAAARKDVRHSRGRNGFCEPNEAPQPVLKPGPLD